VFDVKGFFNASKRIFNVSKKPDWTEYKTMIKITGIGIAIIALVGFVILLFFAVTGIGA
jgi:protein transport protein SEC61 subunit gamma-like protein